MEGLTTAEAQRRLEQYGANMLPKAKPTPLILVFLHQFKSPLIYILLAASVVSLFLGEISDAAFIFAVLNINAIIGTIQEFSAQKSAAALQKMVPTYAMVMRDGEPISVNTEELVPGDIVLLDSGSKVPADIRLHKTHNLLVDESLLTGESVAVNKDSEKKSAEGTPISEQVDTAFAGTIVTHGRGRGEVIATALSTELGRIADVVSKNILIKPPLLLRIEKFTLKLMVIVLIVVALMFIIALAQDGDLAEMFLIAVALAVSAIPEGLPVAITVALSIGMRRMASQSVVVRKLLAVESLGSCTFIASDKTGTLTVNELTAQKVVLADGEEFKVSGEGIKPDGDIKPVANQPMALSRLERIVRTGVLTNEAVLHKPEEEWVAEGDMVDVALLVLGKKCGLNKDEVIDNYQEVGSIPYESENGFSASFHQHEGETLVFAKGAPERIIDMCSKMATLDGDIPLHEQQIRQRMESLAQAGYRVLAFAQGVVTKGSTNEFGSQQLQSLTFLGFVGMIDPLRSEAKEAVNLCRKAGIEVAMITGDHPLTAKAISIELGLGDEHIKVVTGKEIKEAKIKGEEELKGLIAGCRVFARIEPTQKKEIVEILTQRGHFVAVTGDGVNDAPALKYAHVGVAMGKRGTDVARESADLILANDNFSSIVRGIHEGRIVYSNIRKVIFLLVSTGAAELCMFILAMLTGLPMPLVAVQLLWLNLVTNGIQDIALAFEPAEGNELKRPPRAPKEPIFDRLMLERVLLSSFFMGGIGFAVFYWLINHGISVDEARNYVLLLMVLLENVQALNSRSETHSVFRQRFFSNPLLIGGIIIAQSIHIASMYIPGISDVLHIQPVSLMEWGTLLVIACSLLTLDEIYRLFRKHHTLPSKHHSLTSSYSS